MSERVVELEEEVVDRSNVALEDAVERADRAEAELAKLRGDSSKIRTRDGGEEPEIRADPAGRAHALHDPNLEGEDALRQDAMMSHLLDALDERKDIGHYGRLVFAMVGRHFLSEEGVLNELTKDPDFSREQAAAMLRQVVERDYSPPRRERILEWQREQSFPIVPSTEDPDSGNVYRSLHFSSTTYKHIEEYQEERASGGE